MEGVGSESDYSPLRSGDVGRVGAGDPAASRSTSTRSHEEVGSAFLSVTQLSVRQRDEHYWWEDHVPTRLNLAPYDKWYRRLAGHERQD